MDRKNDNKQTCRRKGEEKKEGGQEDNDKGETFCFFVEIDTHTTTTINLLDTILITL